MYASNEDEDWVYLHDTPPTITIPQAAMNLVDYERFSSSSSSKSNRSDSLSSISSTELEQHDDEINIGVPSSNDLEQENRLIETTNIEDPLLFAHNNNTQTTNDDNIESSEQLISTPSMVKEEIVPSEIMNIPDGNNATVEQNTDTPSVINEINTDTPSAINEIDTDTPSVINEINADTPSVINEINADTPSVINEINADTPSAINEIDTDTPSVINEINADTPSVINEINTDTPPEINENDVLNTGFDLSETLSLTNTSESLSLPNDLRRRTGVHVQQTGLYNSDAIQSTPISEHIRPPKRYEHRPKNSDKLVFCMCTLILLTLPFVLGQFVARWNQPMIHKIVEEFDKTNQRLNEVKDLPMKTIEQKLIKQFEEKIQNIIHEQMAWYDQEKYALNFQIREIRHILNITQQHMTNTIHQLTNENGRLQGQIKSLEHRLGVSEKLYPKEANTCPEGVNCTKSSTLDKLVTNIFKQTASIAEDTSDNLSGIFEHLSASVSDVVDHRHAYVEKSKRKLTHLAGSSTAEKVQKTFRRSVEGFSSSLRKAKLTYVTWLKSRAQRAQMENNEKERQKQTPKKHPWRWTVQRNHDNERMRSSTKEHVCQSKSYFPVNQICSMKNWMVKFFQP